MKKLIEDLKKALADTEKYGEEVRKTIGPFETTAQQFGYLSGRISYLIGLYGGDEK